MERLIKNGEPILDGTEPLFIKEDKIFSKLEEYEQIEEQLGISLLTIYKALQYGAYFKRGRTIFHHNVDITDIVPGYGIQIFNTKKWNYEMYEYVKYGKTWALTKEELQ